MKRGEIWTVSDASDYAGKPRPAAIIQADGFKLDSVTVCPITSSPMEAPLFRIVVEPSDRNGLLVPSRLMVDKVTTLPITKVGRCIGILSDRNLSTLTRAIAVFLGVGAVASREHDE